MKANFDELCRLIGAAAFGFLAGLTFGLLLIVTAALAAQVLRAFVAAAAVLSN